MVTLTWKNQNGRPNQSRQIHQVKATNRYDMHRTSGVKYDLVFEICGKFTAATNSHELTLVASTQVYMCTQSLVYKGQREIGIVLALKFYPKIS